MEKYFESNMIFTSQIAKERIGERQNEGINNTKPMGRFAVSIATT